MVSLTLSELMEYTGWERQKWYDWLQQHGDQVLKTDAGPHGDGRFETVGTLVRHIFSAEKRYVERLSSRPLTEAASIPSDKIEALFQFGRQSRKELQELLDTFPAQEWDIAREFQILHWSLSATPRKIVAHILVHEIRHWAQIATLFRLNGLTGEFHDFLFSPAMGGGYRSEPAKA